jgi:flagellar motor component MotA
MKLIILGLLLGVFALVFGMSANLTNLGNLKFFLEPTSFTLVFVPIVGTLLIGCRGSFISSVTSIWKRDVDNQTLDRSIQFWKAAKRYAIAYGFIGSLIGMVFTLHAFGDGDLGGVGPAIAIVVLTVYYGLISGYLVFDPIACLLEARKGVAEP